MLFSKTTSNPSSLGTNTLIIGMGEVGQALAKILSPYMPWHLDPAMEFKNEIIEEVDVMHICFPYSKDFVRQVRNYQQKYAPKITVIHSTVKPGTCRELNAISSPVIGIHPNLEEGLRTFTKFLGGKQASEVADYFRRVGLKVYMFDKPETPEIMKILDTTFYGICLEYVKEVKTITEEFNVPFEAWKIWTDNYNLGYNKLGFPEYTRPNLVPIMKKLGGHCILPNANLLETKFTKFLRDNNA